MNLTKKIKVIIIESVPELLETLSEAFTNDESVELLGAVRDVTSAKKLLAEDIPDAIILDIETPRMDGIEFLRKTMSQNPIPIIIIGSQTQKGRHLTLQALEHGAARFVVKPPTDIVKGLNKMTSDLKDKLKTAITANITNWQNLQLYPENRSIYNIDLDYSKISEKVIAVGASFGSTSVIKNLLTHLSPPFPGIVIVQHMPPGFTKTYADRMNELSALTVKEAENGDKIERDKVLIAPGDIHLKVIKTETGYQVIIENGEKINGKRPSIDVFMHSMAEQVGSNGYGVLLSGIGIDGAHGLLAMKRAGAKTLSIDQKTSMYNKLIIKAIELGAIDKQSPVNELPDNLYQLVIENN